MIQGVKIKKLKVIPDERGRLTEMLRSDDPEFIKFGQAYVTTTYPGAVKAWHYHKKQTDSFVCIHGMAKVVLADLRKGSKTKGEVNEYFIGVHNPVLLQIPPLVYHGFKCVSVEECLIINFPTELYNYKEPDEFRLPAHTKKIKYDWARTDR
jgi:dTDP-4-dehydrorhamnose 3,5-epimerase